MSDHNEHACPKCGSLLHYSCKMDAAIERSYGVKYSKPTLPAMSRDVEVLRDLDDLSADLLAESGDGSIPEALRGRASRHRAALTAAIAALEDPSYVPQKVAAECLKALAPLDVVGEPNTLWALVLKAMQTIETLKQRVEELESHDRHCPGCDGDHAP